MPDYKAPLREVKFLMTMCWIYQDIAANLPAFAENATPDMIDAIVNEVLFCENVLAPINRNGDIEGCTRHEDGSVTTPTGFKEAYKQYVEGGWPTLSHDEEVGGQGMPESLSTVISEFVGIKLSWGMYPGLSHGAMTPSLPGVPKSRKTHI